MTRAWTQITPPVTQDGWAGVAVAIPPDETLQVMVAPGHSVSGLGAIMARRLEPVCACLGATDTPNGDSP